MLGRVSSPTRRPHAAQVGTSRFQRYRQETMDERPGKAADQKLAQEAFVRELLTRVADKWTLLVIEALASGGEMRFSRLKNTVGGGVSQKMLTKTLRQL